MYNQYINHYILFIYLKIITNLFINISSTNFFFLLIIMNYYITHFFLIKKKYIL